MSEEEVKATEEPKGETEAKDDTPEEESTATFEPVVSYSVGIENGLEEPSFLRLQHS